MAGLIVMIFLSSQFLYQDLINNQFDIFKLIKFFLLILNLYPFRVLYTDQR